MKMTKWYFEGQDIKFISSEDNLERHINSNRTRFDAHDKKVIIENEYIDLDQSASAGCATCNGNTPSAPLPTLPVDDKKTRAKSKAVQLSGVSGDVAPTPAPTDFLGDEPNLGLLNGTDDRLAL